MDRSYESAHALVRPAVGPLGSHLGAFVASLIAKGYAVNCVYIKARHVLAFDRWLKTRGLVLGDFDESWIAQYQRSRSRRRSRRIATRRMAQDTLCQLLHFLRDEAVCSQALVDTSLVDKVVAGFGRYLQHEQGLAGTTIYSFARIARQFLTRRFGDRDVRIDAIRPADVIEFVCNTSYRSMSPLPA